MSNLVPVRAPYPATLLFPLGDGLLLLLLPGSGPGSAPLGLVFALPWWSQWAMFSSSDCDCDCDPGVLVLNLGLLAGNLVICPILLGSVLSGAPSLLCAVVPL